jgi:four helix bundle protein
MATVKRFEDLEVFQMARDLANRVYQASAAGRFTRDYDLRGQLRRAALSVMSNIAEGFERGGDKEFSRFFIWPRDRAAKSVRSSMSRSIRNT